MPKPVVREGFVVNAPERLRPKDPVPQWFVTELAHYTQVRRLRHSMNIWLGAVAAPVVAEIWNEGNRPGGALVSLSVNTLVQLALDAFEAEWKAWEAS